MLTTRFAGGLRARPLEARPDPRGLLDLVRHRSPQPQGRRDRRRARRLPRLHRRQGEGLSLAHRARRRAARPCQGGRDLEEDRRRLVGWTARSERLRAAGRAAHRRIVGRTVERRGRRLRIRQGARHRPKAEPGREPQGRGATGGATLAGRVAATANRDARHPAPFIEASGRRYALASRSSATMAAGIARPARPSWVTTRTNGRPCWSFNSAARARHGCRPAANGAASTWRGSLICACAAVPGMGKLVTARRSRASDYVDVDVNIPETLTRERPLAFGSPELRPPRRSP